MSSVQDSSALPRTVIDRLRQPWIQAGLLLVVVFGALLGLFADTVSDAVGLWLSNSAFNHCFLIIPISVYLVSERRDKLIQLQPVPDWRGLIPLAAFAVAWLAASVAGVAEGQQIAMVGMMQAAILAVFGWRVFKLMLLPILYLWLLVPTGDFILPLLQEIAARQTEFWLWATGIPFYREGTIIEVPIGAYWIAPGCAGLNFILSTIALAPLYVMLVYVDPLKRVLAVIIALVVASVANGIRVYGIIALAEFTDRRIDIADDHLFYGWGFFVVVMFALGLVGLLFADPPADSRPVARETADAPPAPTIPIGRMAVMSALVIAIAAAFAVYGAAARGADPGQGRVDFDLAALGPWRTEPPSGDWNLDYPGAHEQFAKRYRSDECCVDVRIAYFWRESEGRELVSSGNALADPDLWTFAGFPNRAILVGDAPVTVNVTDLTRGSKRRVIWWWYWVDGRYTDNRLWAKLLQAKSMLLWGERRSAVIAISAEVTTDRQAAEATIADFLSQAETLKSALSDARWVSSESAASAPTGLD